MLNTRVPVASLGIFLGGSLHPATKTQDNAFIITEGGPFKFPIGVQLTSVLGDVVNDTLISGTTGTIQGDSQFPLQEDLEVVNTTSTTGGASIQGAAGPVQVCNVTLAAYSACGGVNTGVGDAQIPGSCCPDGFSCVRQTGNPVLLAVCAGLVSIVI